MTGLLLQPHAQSLLLGKWGREKRFEQFLSETQRESSIDSRKFWEFRERYSPGSFSFDSGVEHLGTQVIQQLPQAGDPLHTFRGPHLVSRDYVVTIKQDQDLSESFEQFLLEKTSESERVEKLYSTPSEHIYRTAENQWLIAFAKPLEDFIHTNGLFDFTDKERELLQDTFWVNVTLLE